MLGLNDSTINGLQIALMLILYVMVLVATPAQAQTSEAAAQRARMAQAMDANSAIWEAETEGVHHETLKLRFRNPKSLGAGMTDEQVCTTFLRDMPKAIDTARRMGFLRIKLDLRPRVVTCRI